MIHWSGASGHCTCSEVWATLWVASHGYVFCSKGFVSGTLSLFHMPLIEQASSNQCDAQKKKKNKAKNIYYLGLITVNRYIGVVGQKNCVAP